MTAPAMLSHFGIHVTDPVRMEAFYTAAMGLLVTDRGTLPHGPTLTFLSHDPDQHHQLVLVTGRPPGLEYNVVNQISFKLPGLADLKAAHARLRADGVKEFRIVTHGNAWSIYFADPEGNRVELFVDTPWHTLSPSPSRSTSRPRWRRSRTRPSACAGAVRASRRAPSGGPPRWRG
jgi:catechol 2,3-dioxygenase